MTLILSALLVAAQLPVASDANDLEMALVKTLTQKEVKKSPRNINDLHRRHP